MREPLPNNFKTQLFEAVGRSRQDFDNLFDNMCAVLGVGQDSLNNSMLVYNIGTLFNKDEPVPVNVSRRVLRQAEEELNEEGVDEEDDMEDVPLAKRQRNAR
ncbi:uncharacterized protein LOC117647889 [Thrips palmi]|uniref:Uncharacterized protein LOC117647889 n=1 Tax=Thrips palmi TaxID=161013 RepID=A0A6P8ZQF3_THRPL|nr:uncharacterized protein LOC117647889 [Thrips palmi]